MLTYEYNRTSNVVHAIIKILHRKDWEVEEKTAIFHVNDETQSKPRIIEKGPIDLSKKKKKQKGEKPPSNVVHGKSNFSFESTSLFLSRQRSSLSLSLGKGLPY